MDVVLLAVIGLVVLLGIVAIAIGNKGWSWGTVAAAILLLLATTGYIYLAARLAERERSWRAKIAKTQTEIDRLNPPDSAANGKSLAALRTKRDRWSRALTFVDTWHGRTWPEAKLTPPRDGKPGKIKVEMASGENAAAPLAKGAEVAVFDNADVKDEGRFLGLFRITAVEENKGAEECVLTIVPAATPAPPSERDKKLWTRPEYDNVTVYESLPVDTWLAFHKMPADAAGADGKAGADDTAGPDGKAGAGDGKPTDQWKPKPKKTSGEESLKDLEEQMKGLQQHDRQVPEDEWPQLAEKKLFDGTSAKYLKGPDGTDAIQPGRYWAVVEFTKDVSFTKADKFALVDTGDAAAGGGDGGPAAPIGGMIDGEANDGGEERAISPEPSAGAITKWFELKKERQEKKEGQKIGHEGFRKGEEVELDLQTALELQNDKQWVRIKSVKERRPLSDPLTAIRGSAFSAKVNGQPVRAEGIDALRQGLLVEMTSIDQATTRVKASHDNVEAQTAAVAEETKQLQGDLTSWEKDVSAATDTAQAFDDRLRAATIELAALENSIVRLGKELAGAWGTLTETIDGATSR